MSLAVMKVGEVETAHEHRLYVRWNGMSGESVEVDLTMDCLEDVPEWGLHLVDLKGLQLRDFRGASP